MAKAEINIAMEKVLHNAMREIAQTIWDKHGICITSVNFHWADISTMAEKKMILTDIAMESLTKS